MPALAVQITRYVDDHFPGFVECTFQDADYTLGIDFRLVMKAQHRNAPRENRDCLKCGTHEGALAAVGLAHDLAPNVIWPALLLLADGCGAARNGRRAILAPPRDGSLAGSSSKISE